MKFRSIISTDYNAYYYFVAIIAFIFVIMMFVTLIIFDITSEKNSIISSVVYTLIFIIFLIIFIIKIIIRINIINKIIRHGIIVNMEILESINFPRDQYNCKLNYNGIIYKSILKTSKKNRMKLDEYCKKGNIVNIGFLDKNIKNVIFIDLYK